MDDYGVEMSDKEIAEFLEQQGHGVLSFGGDKPYGMPISFGYDVLNNRCIFQLVSDAESRKEAALERSTAVNLVAYEWKAVDDWRSIIIAGELTPILEDSPDAIDASEIFSEHASVANLAVFNKPLSELTPVWHELTIAELSGRQAPDLN